MAKQIAKLLKTDIMADIDMPALAQLLQKLGRKGDKILAHITPKEAKKLKREGGAGTTNPATGLPEFYDGEDIDPTIPISTETAPSVAATSDYDVFQTGVAPETMYAPGAGYTAPEGYAPAVMPQMAAPVTMPSAQIPSFPSAAEADTAQFPGIKPAETPALEDKNFLQRYLAGLDDKQKSELLLKGGLGIGAGLLSGLQAQRARKAAQQARSDIEAIGAPYRAQGQEMMAQARAGELTPASQRQLEASRAALAQGIARRGGVGAQAAATQLQAFRQQLLDNQYNYGLKIANIGDAYAQRAIQVGLQQDRTVSSGLQGLMSAAGAFMGERA